VHEQSLHAPTGAGGMGGAVHAFAKHAPFLVARQLPTHKLHWAFTCELSFANVRLDIKANANTTADNPIPVQVAESNL
jgi:hypothetical protein